MLGAVTLDYHSIVKQLRIIAETWFQDKADAIEMVEIINDFKQLVADEAPVWRLWKLISQIEPKASNWMLKNFMRMLKRNGLLDYVLPMPEDETETECLQGEHSFSTIQLEKGSSSSARQDYQRFQDSLDGKWLLLTVTTHKQLLTLPLKWEGSVSKVGFLVTNEI